MNIDLLKKQYPCIQKISSENIMYINYMKQDYVFSFSACLKSLLSSQGHLCKWYKHKACRKYKEKYLENYVKTVLEKKTSNTLNVT